MAKGAKQIDLRRQLRKLTLPLFFDIALVMLVGAVDTVMLSRCGDGPVGAVGMVNLLMGLVFLVYQFLATGAAILCAQYFGASARLEFVQTALLAVCLNILIGLAVSAALYTWAGGILALMGLRDELMGPGLAYLKITGGLSLFASLSLTFSAVLRSADHVVEPMAVNIAANILNVFGNWVLIFGHLGLPALGVEGAALATALARVFACCALAVWGARIFGRAGGWRLMRMRNPLRPFPWKCLGNLFHVGIPAMSEEISYCSSQVATIYFINQISTDALTTKTYCSNLVMFVFLFCLAVTHGGDILVGHLVGRKRYSPAYLVGTFFLRRSMAVTMICSSLLAIAGPFILPFLTTNKTIINTGVAILALDVILEIGRVRNIFACGTLRAAGDVVYPVIVGVIVQWTVGVGVAWLLGLPLGLGLIGIWIGFTLDENIRGVILMRRWHSQSWRGKSFVR